MFETKKINAIVIPWEILIGFEGNVTFPTIGSLLEESFKTTPYVHIEDEDRIWHCSEKDLLLAHIQQRIAKGGGNE